MHFFLVQVELESEIRGQEIKIKFQKKLHEMKMKMNLHNCESAPETKSQICTQEQLAIITNHVLLTDSTRSLIAFFEFFFAWNMSHFSLCIISSMWCCAVLLIITKRTLMWHRRATGPLCMERALYWYSPVYKWALKQNKTKEEAKWRTTKKNWKNLVFNLNRAELSRYHRASERERTVTRECSCHSQPPCTLTQEKMQLCCTQAVCIYTPSSLTLPHTHS